MRKKIVRKRTFIENFFKVTISLFFLGGFLFFFPVAGLLKYIIPVFLVLSFITIILNVIYVKKGICRLPMIISFIITVIFMCVSISTPIICITFENTKLMYPIKKAIFAYGVRVHSEATMARLPEKLPKNTKDYLFRTVCCSPAQGAYLYFRTDAETITQLEKECKEKGGQVTECEMSFEEFLESYKQKSTANNYSESIIDIKRQYLQTKGFPPIAFQFMSDDMQEQVDEDLIVYNFNSSYGYAFDYDSGIVVVWG